MRTATLYGILGICVLALPFCAQKKTKIAPSMYLFSTKRASSNMINDLKGTLEAIDYEVRTVETNLGILTTRAKDFSGDVEGTHRVQVRQEGGSVKVRIKYMCDYNGQLQDCIKEDPATFDTISGIESELVDTIKQVIAKKDKRIRNRELEGLADRQE